MHVPYGRASKIRLNGVSVARRNRVKPNVGLVGALASGLDRRIVIIDAYDLGGREGPRHEDGARAVAAADVGDPSAGFQLLDDAIE